jgi:hypothetical protein
VILGVQRNAPILKEFESRRVRGPEWAVERLRAATWPESQRLGAVRQPEPWWRHGRVLAPSQGIRALEPRLTSMIVPVSTPGSWTRYITARVTSSASIQGLAIGLPRVNCRTISSGTSVSGSGCTIGVRTVQGHTTLTVIPSFATSRARDLARPMTPHLVAL